MKQRSSLWAWLWAAVGAAYFVVPLVATLNFSLRAKRNSLSLAAYANVLNDGRFWQAFGFSLLLALLTIIVSVTLLVPTAFWVQLRLPQLRPVVELVTLLPFVIPGIVLVFGLIKLYSGPPLPLTSSRGLLVAGYVVLALPYMYRAIDTGLRTINVRLLTEAAQSLGAGWFTIIFRIIVPNIRVAILSGAFLTLSIVIGELILAQYLAWPAFGPYMALVGQDRAYEPAALAMISLALTWGAIALMQYLGRNRRREAGDQSAELTGR